MIVDQLTALPIMVVGDGKLANSVASNMLAAGHQVSLLTTDSTAAHLAIQCDVAQHIDKLDLLKTLPNTLVCPLIVVVNSESVAEKTNIIQQLEPIIADDALIAINTESIPLAELHAVSRVPGRILGLNWAYPAHKTLFAEIIANNLSDPHCIRIVELLAREKWGKDPYTVRDGFSTRGRMFAAMVREAAYLVHHGYATVESVDRACRNDAGYYLPFAGNFRYMDLMGTYSYGMVMKDLNPELSNATQLPPFIEQLLQTGATGMQSGSGFYPYDQGSEQQWEEVYKGFSDEIRTMILKYNHEETIDC